LILNGIFLAAKINRETNVLTLPDVLSKRYGKTVEFFISLVTIVSFLMLLAGNLVGMGVITSYLWGTSEELGIWVAAIIVWAYTVSGGLFSVAYTDVLQGAVGWCVTLKQFLLVNTVLGTSKVLIQHNSFIFFLSQVWLRCLCLLSDCE
jgi:Na+/proline symporter